jgi:hypothetical protein
MSTCQACGTEAAAGARFCAACGVALAAPPSPADGHSPIYDYVPHPHIERRKRRAPKRPAAPAEAGGAWSRFNTRLGVAITKTVGTMWCAYAFALIACVSLPDAVRGGSATLIPWIAQTFLQLVLLSIIMVGQRVEGAAAETRAIDTYQDAEALLAEVQELQKHLLAQDRWLRQALQGAPAPGVQGGRSAS